MTTENPFLPYGRQTIEDDDIDAVAQTLKADFLTTGPKVKEFEDKLAEITGAKYAVAVGNGTHALHLACIAAGLSEGTAAIVPTLTFLATANAVRYCDADVIFADVDPQTGLIQADHVKELLEKHKNKNIKAVLPVHLGGQMADLKAIQAITKPRGIKIIADSCHAIGSQNADTNVGACAYEDIATFSFHPVKTIAMGEGGAITTNEQDTAEQMRALRSHGMSPKPEDGMWAYEMGELGYNYRVTDIQCALGISQLGKLDRFIKERQSLADRYDELLAPLAPIIAPPKRGKDQNPAWHLYAVRIDFDALGKTRDALMKELKEQNIGTQVHYIPVHTQPYYKDLYGKQDLPGAEHYYKHTLSLPLYPGLEEKDLNRIANALKAACG